MMSFKVPFYQNITTLLISGSDVLLRSNSSEI